MNPKMKLHAHENGEPHFDFRHFGSPYAPGPDYWPEHDPRLRYQLQNPGMYGSPYAPGPAYEPYEIERWSGYGRGRYGSPYAPGPAYPESGPYTGIGPRNYKRDDMRIFEDICDSLMQHSEIDASEIDVVVTGGEVTLSGKVDSLYTKRAVEDTALAVLGVQDVHNELKISRKSREYPQHFSYLTDRNTFKTGMPVVGRDGGIIGTISEVRGYDFKVTRESEPAVFVPFEACLAVNGGVVLEVTATSVEQQHWPTVS
jgi:hypothetical protein